MKYLLSADEMKEYDRNTIETIGMDAGILMERAALCARDHILQSGISPRTAYVLAGYGNNGADGLALARLLAEEGYLVEVKTVGNAARRTPMWSRQRSILEHYPEVRFVDGPSKECYGVVVDALFGVGLSREVTGDYQEAIAEANQLQGYKCALDIPSGIHGTTGEVLGTCFEADATVTFGFYKRGLVLFPGCKYAGKVILGEIGITKRSFFGKLPELFTFDAEEEYALPQRAPEGNKGTFGKVLMVCGSKNMAGAAVLSGRACYRIGAGMVKIISCEENRAIIQETIPDAMYGTYEGLIESMGWADVLVIGPGISTGEEAGEALREMISEGNKPLLIDADGINGLASDWKLIETLSNQGEQGRQIVLTPHCGELYRLLNAWEDGPEDMTELKKQFFFFAKRLAARLHAVVVAKDARTLVCREEGKCFLNVRGNSGMAVAGSGDVLTGIIAGLMAQGKEAFEAGCVGVTIHGVLGERAASELGEHGCMASDLISYMRK